MTLRELKERERLAYITGDTELAKLLGELMDAQDELCYYQERYYDND